MRQIPGILRVNFARSARRLKVQLFRFRFRAPKRNLFGYRHGNFRGEYQIFFFSICCVNCFAAAQPRPWSRVTTATSICTFRPRKSSVSMSAEKSNGKIPARCRIPTASRRFCAAPVRTWITATLRHSLGISLKGKWVTVSYQTAEGRLEQAQQDLEYFYDYWVKMYLRRSNRAKLPPPSDPTVLVTWQGIQSAHGISKARG